jgi:hypothetical protein
MFAPPDAVDALHRLHPAARLGWHGLFKKSQGKGELNEGRFSLLELYLKKESELIMYEPWDDRGPVYGKPYDRDSYNLHWLADFSIEDVCSGAFIKVIEGWRSPLHKRLWESARDKGAAMDKRTADLAKEMSAFLRWRGNKSSWGPVIVPRKHMTAEDKALLRGEVEIPSFKDDFFNNETDVYRP